MEFTAMLIAPFIIFAKGGLYTYLQKMGGLFSVPIFTILVIGLVTKRIPAIAAKVGLFFFIVSYGLTQMVFDVQLHFLHVLAILFLLTAAIMLLIGRLNPMTAPFELKKNTFVSIEPWKYRHLFSVLLIGAMILLYILFSPYGIAGK